MSFIIYKLIFPECNSLYVGSGRLHRYRIEPNSQFSGPHHNHEVQALLDKGYFCYFHVIAYFEEAHEARSAEEGYIRKVWPTDKWSTRPSWLLNRNRNACGFASGEANPVHQLTLEQMQENVKSMQTPEAQAKSRASLLSTLASLETHWNKGRPRPDMEKPQTPKQKAAARKAALLTFPCPHCGREMNRGNLVRHIKAKHK